MTTQSYIGTELELFGKARNWKNYYASILGPYLHGRVLEVGAGIGETAAVLCNGGQELWLCLEPDAQLSATVEHKIAAGTLPSCCTAKHGCISDIAPGPQFNVILYIDVLEHIRDDREELDLATQRLCPDGLLIVLAPAHQWLFSPFDAAVGHFRRYTKSTLSAIAPAELEIMQCLYLDSVGLIASLGNRYVLRKATPNEKQIRLWDRVMVPASRRIDHLLGHGFGKSVVAIWRRKNCKRLTLLTQ
jgi:2-polyprenyl-3-methyl-5-hydroxy-6-metoxy-1,4-benzoquinol methylase